MLRLFASFCFRSILPFQLTTSQLTPPPHAQSYPYHSACQHLRRRTEFLIETSEIIQTAMIKLMIRRLARYPIS